jgi:hypothetical protein
LRSLLDQVVGLGLTWCLLVLDAPVPVAAGQEGGSDWHRSICEHVICFVTDSDGEVLQFGVAYPPMALELEATLREVLEGHGLLVTDGP